MSYCLAQAKQKFVKKLVQEIQRSTIPCHARPPKDASTLKCGSWNIDGLKPGTNETLGTIIESERFHVIAVSETHNRSDRFIELTAPPL